MKKLISLGLLLSVLAACDKEKNINSSSSSFQEVASSFLTISNFTSSNEFAAASSELSSEMSSWSELWNYKASTSDSSTDSCFTNFKIKLLASDSVQIGGAEDITACINEKTSVQGLVLTKLKMKLFIQLQCEGADLSSFQTQSMSNSTFSDLETACNHSTVHILKQSESESDVSITFGGTTFRTWTLTQQATMNSQSNTCTYTFDGTNWVMNDCTQYTKTHYYDNTSDTSKIDKDEITWLTDNNIIRTTTFTDPFFVSGTRTIYFQGWNGSITYNGVNTNASWSLTKDGDTLSGSISPNFLLHGMRKEFNSNNLMPYFFSHLSLLR